MRPSWRPSRKPATPQSGPSGGGRGWMGWRLERGVVVVVFVEVQSDGVGGYVFRLAEG